MKVISFSEGCQIRTFIRIINYIALFLCNNSVASYSLFLNILVDGFGGDIFRDWLF